MVSSAADTPKHPWRRYAARMIDNALAGILGLPTFFIVGFAISVLLKLLGLHAEETDPAIARLILKVLYVSLVCLWMIGIETLLLSTWGTTPGKRLLSLYVYSPDGSLLDQPNALKRSIWVNGALFAVVWVPFLGIIFNTLFMVYQRRQLLTCGYTSWDKDQRTLVARI